RRAMYLLDGDVRRDQAARVRIIVQPVEAAPQPIGNRGAATIGEPQQLRKARDGEYPGYDVDVNTRRCAAVAVAQERVRIKKELRDGAAGAGIDFALQILHVGGDAARFRMT